MNIYKLHSLRSLLLLLLLLLLLHFSYRALVKIAEEINYLTLIEL